MVVLDEEEYLAHYGILRRSGRYPWGSSSSQNVRNKTFLEIIKSLRADGLTDTDICKGFDISTTQLRAATTIARAQQRQTNIAMAQRLKDKGYSNPAIAQRMNLPGESSVRALLAPGVKDRNDVLKATSDMLKREVDAKQFVMIGSGVEHYVGGGISKEKLAAAVAILKEQGYAVHTVPVPQLGTGKDTKVKVLAPPGTTWGDVRRNQDNIKSITEFTSDGGHSFNEFKPPIAVNPKRVSVNFKEDGGSKADGVIYVRPGVKDVSLGNARYAQVRIQVGNGHYLKGMAMYKDDLPEGVDLVFNTNKPRTKNKLDAMKELQADPDLPFGSVVRQILDRPGHKDAKPTSAMNIVNEEGRWSEWSKNLSSQMLSKQSPILAKTQLSVTYDRRKQEFDEIMALTNPTVRKKLLEEFAEGADSAAVHLKAAALPRQATHVILPLSTISPSEIYAPGYNDGERVALVRYPHGGTFEIPELTVNNRQREGKKLLGSDTRDAVGIHHTVAERLSGADFDGDTVIVIPNNQGKVKISPALDKLRNFDPQSYKLPDDSPIPRITAQRKQQLMGDVSNLITDMTIKGASHEALAPAIRHSMVVIDAEKHNLNYRQSAIDNGIAKLKAEYQGGPRAGASTLVSRKKSEDRIPETKPRPQSQGGPIDKATGRRIFVETGRTRTTRTGDVVTRTQKVNKLDRTDDAHTLASGTRIESIYADHSNKLKDLANTARLAAVNTPALRYSSSAKQTYSRQVERLNSALALAERNAPRERQAQIIANAAVRAKRDANPNLESDTLKKIKYQELETARVRVGARREKIVIEQDEWDAIQAGAISNDRLSRILTNADIDRVRALATPRREILMSPNMTQRAQQLLARGYTRAQVAADLGVSVSTLDVATTQEEG